jgi:hypothetical protein
MVGFVSGGRRRAIEAIRAEVEAKYAGQLNAAAGAEKMLLKKQIEAEIRVRLKEVAPPNALYSIDSMNERPDQCPACGRLQAAPATRRAGETKCAACGNRLWFVRIADGYFVFVRRDAIPDEERARLERLAATARDSIDTVEIVMELEEYLQR